jgi:hypothetical protein
MISLNNETLFYDYNLGCGAMQFSRRKSIFWRNFLLTSSDLIFCAETGK